MPTVFVQQPDCHLHLKSERLEVWSTEEGRDRVIREIPLRDIDRVILAEGVEITSHALGALLRQGIPISFMSWGGNYLGGFLPASNSHGQARLAQYQRTTDPAFTLQMSGRIVAAKLYNQRRVLQRLLATRRETSLSEPAGGDIATLRETVAWLDGILASITRSRSIDELRGYEGVTTARYLQAWACCLPPQFPFERRSTRPPLNPVNACISFGATLVYHEAVAYAHAHGLDPALGLMHTTEDGRWALPLDFIEPFRPALVEALALDLFTHEMLNESHFEPQNGGVYLNAEGRKKFILQYERRMERQFMSECAGHRTSLRLQLEQQAVMLKSALTEPDKYQPFLMN